MNIQSADDTWFSAQIEDNRDAGTPFDRQDDEIDSVIATRIQHNRKQYIPASHEIRNLRKEAALLEWRLQELCVKWKTALPHPTVLLSACEAAKEKVVTMKVERVNAQLKHLVFKQQFHLASIQHAVTLAPLWPSNRRTTDILEDMHQQLCLGGNVDERIKTLNRFFDTNLKRAPDLVQRYTQDDHIITETDIPYSRTGVACSDDATVLSNVFVCRIPNETIASVFGAIVDNHSQLPDELERHLGVKIQIEPMHRMAAARCYARVRSLSGGFDGAITNIAFCGEMPSSELGVIAIDFADSDALDLVKREQPFSNNRRDFASMTTLTKYFDDRSTTSGVLLQRVTVIRYNLPPTSTKRGWGPTRLPEQFLNVPYAPFNKGDKLGKAADFVSNYVPRGGRHPRDPSGVNAEFQYKYDADEDATFRLVDTAKTARARGNDRLRPSWNQQRFGGRGGFAGQRGGPGGRFGAAGQDANGAAGTAGAQSRIKGQQKLNKRWDRLSNARRMFTGRRRDEVKIDRTATVKVEASWQILEQFELQQLTRLQANVPDAEDLRCPDRRITRFDDRDFFYVTTTDDPVIEELATSGEANRVNNMVFFDKRDNSPFDLVSVNENASEPPASDDPESVNHPDRLSLEATMINQNLSQQVVKGDGAFRKEHEHPNPFASEDSQPATYAYRYRKFDLGGGMNLVTRCEVHGVSLKNNNEALVATYALNEYDPKLTGATEWRKKIDSQRGAILANELKNNANKLAKWTAQALLSGVDEMKLAYVSRVNYKDPYSHVLLGVQSYNPSTFATQIALNQNNMWGIIKMLAELMLEQPEGKYVIMKDPTSRSCASTPCRPTRSRRTTARTTTRMTAPSPTPSRRVRVRCV
ncbi:hypothetical protein PINS_up014814 [Pythium insidiosum]|nr:hypothetical protein PINS_up014814 [Pythium insidiosum]